MDVCRRPATYDTVNRNKASFTRPPTSSAPNLPAPYSKMAAVHSQVREPAASSVTQCLPPNPNKPTGYSVRMESTVPLVTQAPAIQSLQIRPGVITQQTWSNRAQQILVPAWQQVTPVVSDSMAGPQRLADWGKVHPHANHYSAILPHPHSLLTNHMTAMSAHQPISIGIAHVVWPQPAANKRNKPCANRTNFSHHSNTQTTVCHSPKTTEAHKRSEEAEGRCPETGVCVVEAEPQKEESAWCKVDIEVEAGSNPPGTSETQRQAVTAETPSPTGSVISISSDDEDEEEEGSQRHSAECKGSPECEACRNTLNMESVCSLSSPDSSLSTSSSASVQSRTSPCKRPNSMSGDEGESGCDTVDGSPASDSSGRVDSPFLDTRFIADGNQNCNSRAEAETEMSKDPVRTMMVPPMRQNNNKNVMTARTVLEPTCQSKGRAGAVRQSHHTTSLLNRPLPLSQQPPPPPPPFGQLQHPASTHTEWNGNYSHRHPQAFIPSTVHSHTFTLSHGSPTRSTARPPPPLGVVQPHVQPALLSYPPSAPLMPTGPMSHLLPSPGATRSHMLLSHPARHLVHQVSVGISARLLPSPTLHPQGQFKPLFPSHSFIASPAYAGFPLSPTKLGQYSYI
ncbi:Homeodomain-interacting protein kinase 3 [Bagarius yarrelli]|uniref:Homeodomain-interacting protein kinase 3 n=1 Tax=Bagarius yarrelli TaxID=175774 RepID=A0A556V8I8_BAGYA|nr:Homeodomain-interacting protein kinase 3 [Bagarius yarrelli]